VSRRRRRALLSVALVVLFTASLLAAATAGPAAAAAAPPPEDVSGTCGPHFEAAVADAGGPDVTVSESRPGVYLHENGTATVFSYNALAPRAADWVANHTDAVADELAATEAGLDESKADLSVRVRDDEATVAYTDADFAHRSVGGALVVDAFTRTATRWDVNCGEFWVWARGSYTAVTHTQGAWALSWTDSIDTDHVVFAPDRGPLAVAAGELALSAATAPAFLRGAAVALAPFVGALAVLFRAVDAAAELAPPLDRRTAGGAAVAAGGAAALAVVAAGRASLYFTLPAAIPLFTGATAVAVGLAVLAGRDDALSLSLAAVGVPLSLGVLAALVGGLVHPAVAGWTVGRALAAGCLAAQAGVFAVLGATRDAAAATAVDGDRTRHRRRFAAAAAPAVAVVALLGPTAVVLAWVLALFVLAPLAYWLGAAAAGGLRSV